MAKGFSASVTRSVAKSNPLLNTTSIATLRKAAASKTGVVTNRQGKKTKISPSAAKAALAARSKAMKNAGKPKAAPTKKTAKKAVKKVSKKAKPFALKKASAKKGK